jgi:hypothetical protein
VTGHVVTLCLAGACLAVAPGIVWLLDRWGKRADCNREVARIMADIDAEHARLTDDR